MFVGAGYSRHSVGPREDEVAVSEGGLLVIYSDGVIEARNAAGALFGKDGIIAAVQQTEASGSPEVLAEAILSAAASFSGKVAPEDDQTLVVVQIGEPSLPVVHGPSLQEMEAHPDLLEFSLVNAGHAGAASGQLAPVVLNWATERLGSPERALAVWAATYEAIQNAVKYGSVHNDVIAIRLKTLDEGLEVEFVQPNVWESWPEVLGESRRAAARAAEIPIRLGGGTITMLRLADEVRCLDHGCVVQLRFRKGKWSALPD